VFIKKWGIPRDLLMNHKTYIWILGAIMTVGTLDWHTLDRSIPATDSALHILSAMNMEKLSFLELFFYKIPNNPYILSPKLTPYLLIPAVPFFESHFYLVRMMYVLPFSLLFITYALLILSRLANISTMIVCAAGITLSPWFLYMNRSIDGELPYWACSLAGFYHLIVRSNQNRRIDAFLCSFFWLLAIFSRPFEGLVNLSIVLILFLFWRGSLKKIFLLWPLLPSVIFLIATILLSEQTVEWQRRYSVLFQLLTLTNISLFVIWTIIKNKNTWVLEFSLFYAGLVLWFPLRANRILYWLNSVVPHDLQTGFIVPPTDNVLKYLIFFLHTSLGIGVWLLIFFGFYSAGRILIWKRTNISQDDKFWGTLLLVQSGFVFTTLYFRPSPHYMILNTLLLMFSGAYFLSSLRTIIQRIAIICAITLLVSASLSTIDSLKPYTPHFLNSRIILPYFNIWRYTVVPIKPHLDIPGNFSHDLKKLLDETSLQEKRHIGYLLEESEIPNFNFRLANTILGGRFQTTTNIKIDPNTNSRQYHKTIDGLNLSHILVITQLSDPKKISFNNKFILNLESVLKVKLIGKFKGNHMNLGPVELKLFELI